MRNDKLSNEILVKIFVQLPMSGLGFLFFAVVYVIALCGFQVFFKVGDTVLNENVIPLKQFLDVAVVHAVAVKLGQHLGEILTQFLARCLAIVD